MRCTARQSGSALERTGEAAPGVAPFPSDSGDTAEVGLRPLLRARAVRLRRRVEHGFGADLCRRLSSGAVWSFAGAIVSQGFSLCASVAVARCLGKVGFGELGIINSTVATVGVFGGLGLGVTTTKHVAELRDREPRRAAAIIKLSEAGSVVSGALAAALLLLLAPMLARDTLGAAHLAPELRIASALLFLSCLTGAQTGVLAGFEAFRRIARINFVRGLATLPVTLVAVLQWGLSGAVWALTIVMAINWELNRRAIARQCRADGLTADWTDAWRERRVLWTFSAPAFVSAAMVGPVTWAACALLVNQEHGYPEMAVFNAANQWRAAVSFLPGILGQLALPILSSLRAERGRYTKAILANLLVTAGSALAIALPLAIASPWIVRLYGAGYAHGAIVLVMMLAVSVLNSVNSVIGSAISSAGKVWLGLMFNTIWGAVLLVSSFVLIPRYLAVGLAASMLIAYAPFTLVQSLYINRLVGRRGRGAEELGTAALESLRASAD